MGFEKPQAVDERKLANHRRPLRPVEAPGNLVIPLGDQSVEIEKPLLVSPGRVPDHRARISKGAIAKAAQRNLAELAKEFPVPLESLAGHR